VGHAVYALGTWPGSGRIEGLPIQSNALAALLAMCAIPSVGIMLNTQRRAVRVLVAGAIGLMLITIVLTISRGTYISFSLAMFWWLRRSRRMLIVLALAAAGLAWFLGGQVQTADRIRTRFQMRDNSVVNRIKVQQNALRAVLERPVLGLGFAQFAEIERAVDVNAEGGRGSHNFYLGQLASTGIPATLLLFAFVLAQFRPLWQRDGPLSHLPPADRWLVDVLQALAIYQTVSLAVRNLFRQTEWLVLGIYCALLAIAMARARAYQSSGISNSPSPGGASSSSGGRLSSPAPVQSRNGSAAS
jgi:O-antigen ligase